MNPTLVPRKKISIKQLPNTVFDENPWEDKILYVKILTEGFGKSAWCADYCNSQKGLEEKVTLAHAQAIRTRVIKDTKQAGQTSLLCETYTFFTVINIIVGFFIGIKKPGGFCLKLFKWHTLISQKRALTMTFIMSTFVKIMLCWEIYFKP